MLKSKKNTKTEKQLVEGENRKKVPPKEETYEETDETTGEELLHNQEVHGVTVASSDELKFALEVVSKYFKVGKDFLLLGFADKSNSSKITLGNPQFEVTVVIKDKDYVKCEMEVE
jgi:hypothetical protein